MKEYPAIYLNSENNLERLTGKIYVKDDHVWFLSDQNQDSIPFSSLHIDAGNGRSRFIFFRHTQKPAITMYTEDHSILKEDCFRSHDTVIQAFRQKRMFQQGAMGCLGILLLLVFLFISGIFIYRDRMVKALANQIPPEWENQLGEQCFNSLKAEHKLLSDDSLNLVIMDHLQPMLPEQRNHQAKFRVFISRDTKVNAYALPGGYIVIHSGLIQKAESWEELLGVVSHEMAHVKLKHHTRGMIQQAGIWTILSLWFVNANEAVSVLGKIGGEMVNLAYSREFEQEADDEGFRMLQHAGIDPRGMMTFFNRMLEDEAANPGNAMQDLTLLSTHPATTDRIARLKEKLKPESSVAQPLPGWDGFRFAVMNKRGSF